MEEIDKVHSTLMPQFSLLLDSGDMEALEEKLLQLTNLVNALPPHDYSPSVSDSHRELHALKMRFQRLAGTLQEEDDN